MLNAINKLTDGHYKDVSGVWYDSQYSRIHTIGRLGEPPSYEIRVNRLVDNIYNSLNLGYSRKDIFRYVGISPSEDPIGWKFPRFPEHLELFIKEKFFNIES